MRILLITILTLTSSLLHASRTAVYVISAEVTEVAPFIPICLNSRSSAYDKAKSKAITECKNDKLFALPSTFIKIDSRCSLNSGPGRNSDRPSLNCNCSAEIEITCTNDEGMIQKEVASKTNS
ncbi:MAG: hypothetical protein HON90_06405 [Halobacteriovoraceae bacterium]|nr:hypothetical protein [Halobacteriovoraceae bacterium]